jgi:hypothetical protein
LGPQHAPLNSTTHRSDWDIDTINSNNFTGISLVGLGHRSRFPQLSSAVDASHHTRSQEPQPLFSPSQRRNYYLLRLYSLSLFPFHFTKGKKRKRKASSQSVPRSTMSTTPPPALGGARVGNQDARCRLQEGNDAAAPTAPSPDFKMGSLLKVERSHKIACTKDEPKILATQISSPSSTIN